MSGRPAWLDLEKASVNQGEKLRQEPVKRKWTPKRGLFHAKQYYVRSMRRRCWVAALTYMVTRPEFLKKNWGSKLPSKGCD